MEGDATPFQGAFPAPRVALYLIVPKNNSCDFLRRRQVDGTSQSMRKWRVLDWPSSGSSVASIYNKYTNALLKDRVGGNL